MDHEQIIKGDYVLTPCKNAFNNKVSYWLSKNGYTVAIYCFTPFDAANLKAMTSDKVLDDYIKRFQSLYEKV